MSSFLNKDGVIVVPRSSFIKAGYTHIVSVTTDSGLMDEFEELLLFVFSKTHSVVQLINMRDLHARFNPKIEDSFWFKFPSIKEIIGIEISILGDPSLCWKCKSLKIHDLVAKKDYFFPVNKVLTTRVQRIMVPVKVDKGNTTYRIYVKTGDQPTTGFSGFNQIVKIRFGSKNANSDALELTSDSLNPMPFVQTNIDVFELINIRQEKDISAMEMWHNGRSGDLWYCDWVKIVDLKTKIKSMFLINAYLKNGNKPMNVKGTRVDSITPLMYQQDKFERDIDSGEDSSLDKDVINGEKLKDLREGKKVYARGFNNLFKKSQKETNKAKNITDKGTSSDESETTRSEDTKKSRKSPRKRKDKVKTNVKNTSERSISVRKTKFGRKVDSKIDGSKTPIESAESNTDDILSHEAKTLERLMDGENRSDTESDTDQVAMSDENKKATDQKLKRSKHSRKSEKSGKQDNVKLGSHERRVGISYNGQEGSRENKVDSIGHSLESDKFNGQSNTESKGNAEEDVNHRDISSSENESKAESQGVHSISPRRSEKLNDENGKESSIKDEIIKDSRALKSKALLSNADRKDKESSEKPLDGREEVEIEHEHSPEGSGKSQKLKATSNNDGEISNREININGTAKEVSDAKEVNVVRNDKNKESIENESSGENAPEFNDENNGQAEFLDSSRSIKNSTKVTAEPQDEMLENVDNVRDKTNISRLSEKLNILKKEASVNEKQTSSGKTKLGDTMMDEAKVKMEIEADMRSRLKQSNESLKGDLQKQSEIQQTNPKDAEIVDAQSDHNQRPPRQRKPKSQRRANKKGLELQMDMNRSQKIDEYIDLDAVGVGDANGKRNEFKSNLQANGQLSTEKDGSKQDATNAGRSLNPIKSPEETVDEI